MKKDFKRFLKLPVETKRYVTYLLNRDIHLVEDSFVNQDLVFFEKDSRCALWYQGEGTEWGVYLDSLEEVDDYTLHEWYFKEKNPFRENLKKARLDSTKKTLKDYGSISLWVIKKLLILFLCVFNVFIQILGWITFLQYFGWFEFL